MAVKMDEFLLQYYMQLRFNNMPAEVRAQFDTYAKSDDFRGHMKDWKKNLMTDGENNPMPDPTEVSGQWELSDDEWKKLFRAFQTAFRGMDADRKSFKDNKDANEFLDEYFGAPDLKLFSNGVANDAADAQIQGDFKTFLTTYRQSLEIYFKQWGLVDGDFSYSDLLDGIKSKKYNTTPAFQEKVKSVAQYLTFYARQPEFQTALGLQQQNIPDFQAIENGFDDKTINPQKLDYFKRNYRDLLDTLNKKSKVYDVFKAYDKGKISKPFDEAASKVDYGNRDSDDYVPPKRTDELTPWQQLSKNIGDTWSDYMGKYTKFRGDRLYMSNAAKSIVKALDDKKVKMQPTDGLGKLVDNIDNIKSNLLYKSPTAVKHFEWMGKTLKELKDTMPKAFAGALSHGGQMRAIVSEIIMRAVRDGKMDEAKTAMEVLSVIKYGYTTSKIMDALGKEKLSIFSDGKLSWNKNEAVQFVTTAMDKSIKWAFMGIGYGITIAGNAYNLHGSKFNTDGGKRMKDTLKNFNDKDAADRQHLQDLRDTDDAQRQAITDKLDNMRNRGLNETNLDNAISKYRTDIATDQQNIDAQINGVTGAQYATQDELNKVQQYLYQLENGIVPAAAPTVSIPQTQAQIDALHQTALDKQTKQTQLDRKVKKRQEFSDGKNAIGMLSAQVQDRDQKLSEWDEKHQDKYRELMAYWDFLETGRDTHTGNLYSWRPGKASEKQKKFDGNALFQQYLAAYGRAA